MKNSLISKYNVQGPRYTSYPTVPYWDQAQFNVNDWQQSSTQSFNESNLEQGISLYIHLPFCEQLCTFCACHKHITKQHSKELPYIDTLLKEWSIYVSNFRTNSPNKIKLKELHLGGGTPTFFSPENLKHLLINIFADVELDEFPEFSFEGHPNNTTKEHLQTLFDLGFRRVSFGVQDYNLKVQQAIHRLQPFENVANVTKWAREIGYTSISHDLVYGLPHQTWDSMFDTISKTLSLQPDRIAFYSYAHVPWVKGVGQRGFSKEDLPQADVKRALYEKGKESLMNAGYIEIGMDHFSLPTDDLYRSMENQNIHRNFMGYTSSKTQLMIGLGMSAISDSWYAFAQNEKSLEAYSNRVWQNDLPILKGHLLTKEDLLIRQIILDLMCKLETKIDQQLLPLSNQIISQLQEMHSDGLLEMTENHIRITEKGRPFIRNVAMAFDARMWQNIPTTQLFSSTI